MNFIKKMFSGHKLKKHPIVYSPGYNINLEHLVEEYHPFDTKKFEKIFSSLGKCFSLKVANIHVPSPPSREILTHFHPPLYLKSLKSAKNIATIAESPVLKTLPDEVAYKNIVEPVLLATGGTIKALELALEHGWSINLGGGFHHAKKDEGSGFCFIADINIGIQQLLAHHPGLKVLVIDLDAHQGNGYASMANEQIAILDVFNKDIFPGDTRAEQYITFPYPVEAGLTTNQYLDLIRDAIPSAIDKHEPDLIIYNAGTDIHENDLLGELAVSSKGIIERDYLVFKEATTRNIPVTYLLSGGYTLESASIISKSLIHIIQSFHLITS